MLDSRTVSAFVDELEQIKLALSLSELRGVAGPIGKRVGPGGVAKPLSTAVAAPVRNPAKTTLRGQTVPGLASEQKGFQSAMQANQQLQGARSLL